MATVKATYFQSSCKGKLPYKSKGEAEEVVNRMNAENRKLNLIERMEFYHCKYCRNYHVGHELDQEKKLRIKCTKGRGR